jgi:hypothetical protein
LKILTTLPVHRLQPKRKNTKNDNYSNSVYSQERAPLFKPNSAQIKKPGDSQQTYNQEKHEFPPAFTKVIEIKASLKNPDCRLLTGKISYMVDS